MKNTITGDDVVRQITDTLSVCDGRFLQHIANQVLTDKIVWIGCNEKTGEDLFEPKAE